MKVQESTDSFPKKRKGNGKSTFPVLVDEKSSLADLVEDSWYFFKLLKIETDFLRKAVAEWPEDRQYIAGIKTSKMITVINDCSERGVKLDTDFRPSTSVQKNFENTLQLVEKSRCKRPNLRKRTHSLFIQVVINFAYCFWNVKFQFQH